MTQTRRIGVARIILLGGALFAALIGASLSAHSTNAQAQEKRAITFHDLISMHRLSDPQISPDGKWVAYGVATPDLDANHLVKNIWIVAAAGGDARQLTQGGSDERARWSPDGKSIAFLSSREGTAQLYTVAADGGDGDKVTSLSAGADNELWSPDGKSIAFMSSVYPDCKDDACNAARDAAKDKSKVKAHVYEKLLTGTGPTWSDGKRSHLFVVAADGGTPRDLTPGRRLRRAAVQPRRSGSNRVSLPIARNSASPPTRTRTKRPARMAIFSPCLWTARAAPKRITTNPGDDWGPAYSPDGKWIAYRAQLQPGYESDRWRLMLYDSRERQDHEPHGKFRPQCRIRPNGRLIARRSISRQKTKPSCRSIPFQSPREVRRRSFLATARILISTCQPRRAHTCLYAHDNGNARRSLCCQL